MSNVVHCGFCNRQLLYTEMEKSGTNIASHLFYIALLPEIAKDLFEELKKISQISRHDPFKARSLGLICNIPARPPPPSRFVKSRQCV